MNTGFIGLGAMARNLAKAGHPVRAWNRSGVDKDLAGIDPVEVVRPLLEVLGKKIWSMGEDPQRANVAKIAANMMITMAIEALGEAAVLTEANGLSRAEFFELILGTSFAGRAYENYATHITNGDWGSGFKARLGLKDLRLASEAAADAGRQLPMLKAVHGRMVRRWPSAWAKGTGRRWPITRFVTPGDPLSRRRSHGIAPAADRAWPVVDTPQHLGAAE